MANFVRAAGFALFLALGALGFALVGVARTDESVSTTALVIRGEVPVIVGFVLYFLAAYGTGPLSGSSSALVPPSHFERSAT